MDLNERISTAQTYVDQQQWQKALSIYEQLVTKFNDLPDLHYLHALVLFELENYSKALEAIEKAIAIGPEKAAYFQNQADTLCALGRFTESVAIYEKVLELEPDNVDVLLNLGNALHTTGDTQRAFKCYEHMLTLAPDSPNTNNNIGKIYYDQGDIELSLKYYDKSLQLDPDYAEAQFNKAVALLTIGEYTKGLPAYEWRFKRKDAHHVYPHKLSGRRWEGSPFFGESLLIHCEQGLGDVIQYSRFVPMVKALGGRITLEVQAPLAPLLKDLPAVDETIVFDPLKPPVVHYDQYIPIGSLPMLMKTTLDTIPARVPYFKADEDKAAHWQNRLATKGLRVGLVWSGSDVDPHRACRLYDWHPWWINTPIHFYSLQKGPAAKQLTELADTSSIEHLGTAPGTASRARSRPAPY